MIQRFLPAVATLLFLLSSFATPHESARIFYFVMIHNERTFDDALFLLRSIHHPSRNHILVHVDTKAQHLLKDIGSSNHPWYEWYTQDSIQIESLFNVEWSKWSMNEPTLWAMKVAVQQYPAQWDVFINLSGDTLAVYDTDTIGEALHELPFNFVTSRSCETGLLPTAVHDFPSFWHKRRHYTQDETEQDPIISYRDDNNVRQKQRMTPYFGSQWVILKPEFCQWIVQGLERPDSLPSRYREYLKQSQKLMTDETFLPSLLMNVFPQTLPLVDHDGYLLFRNHTASSIIDIRFERMDEHTPTSYGAFPTQQRYTVPDSQLSRVEQTRAWGPYYLGVYDLADIRQSGALYCRKVTSRVDPNLVKILPVKRADEIPFIQWPSVELSLTEKPDWDRKVKQAFTDMLKEEEASSTNAESEIIEEKEL